MIRTYVVSRLIYEADRGPRPAAQPENRPRRDLVAPVCTYNISVAGGAARRRPRLVVSARPRFPGTTPVKRLYNRMTPPDKAPPIGALLRSQWEVVRGRQLEQL